MTQAQRHTGKRGRACVTFCTTVPGVVVVVAAVLAIARVVLPVVRHQILSPV